MGSKYLVIGSNSFSGSAFCAHVLASDSSVIGVSRSDQPKYAFLPHAWGSTGNFAFHKFDLNSHIDQILDLIEEERPQYIVNFAAQSMVGESWNTPEDWFLTNTVSTVKLFNRLKDCEFLNKYVHVTTPEVYGSCSGDVTENAPFNPSTPYAVSRAAGDMCLRTFVANYRFPAVFTRAANVYGAGQQLYRIIPKAILYARQGKKLELHGGGGSERSFIHINDVCRATLKIATDGRVGEEFHISTNETISIKGLVQLICDKLDVEFEKLVVNVQDRPGKDAAYLLNSNKLRNTLGWRENISLSDGIDSVIEWVEKNIDVLRSEPDIYVHKK